MKRKILKFFGLALQSDLLRSRKMVNDIFNRIEQGVDFLVLKEGQELMYENLKKDVIIKHPNCKVQGNRIEGTVWINSNPYGNVDGLIFIDNVIVGMNGFEQKTSIL